MGPGVPFSGRFRQKSLFVFLGEFHALRGPWQPYKYQRIETGPILGDWRNQNPLMICTSQV